MSSKKIMPQVIQPAPQQHSFPGKGHDLPDLGAILLAVAMDLAILARRFRLERAFTTLVHSVGHEKRLNRFGSIPNDRFASYSFEELVAEFGAAFLCAFTGISNPVSDALQAGYIDGWAKAIRQDQRLIVRAASAAQIAADYVRGKIRSEAADTNLLPATVGDLAGDTSAILELAESASANPQAVD